MRRKLSVVTAMVAVSLALPGAASAHAPGDKVGGRCSVTNTAGQAQMVVEVDNISGGSLKNVDPNQLSATNVGSASIFFQTSPRPIRELLSGKTGTFKWKGRLFGDGFLDISVEVEAEAEDGHIGTTGVINCNRVTVGDPGSIDPPPTNTPRPRETAPVATPTTREVDTPTMRPTAAGRPTRTPRPTSTSRPTRTPIVADPTRTPRSTSTPRITNTPRPTRTPINGGPTRTPRATSTPRPTRTEAASRPTRTPIQARPTRTPAGASATRTRVPPRPTRTRMPTATSRPTRTPVGGRQPTTTPRPTRTPEGAPTQGTPDYDINGLHAHCSLRRNIDLVTITMLVRNDSGVDIRNLEASRLELAPEGGALFFDRAGPIPGSYTSVRRAFFVSFQWTGRLTPGGTMGFSAFARGTTPDNREIRTEVVDCGTATAAGGGGNFEASCTIRDGDLGGADFVVTNRTGVALTRVLPIMRARDTSGSAQILDLTGPVPSGTTRLNNTQQVLYGWRARILGRGTVSMEFEATAIQPNAEPISTGLITCTRDVNTVGGNLPDLTISEVDLRNSLEIHTENFRSDDCAIEEGCVDGPGSRRLLRFDTVTPNLGPGDVFVGDPSGNGDFVFSQCHAHFHFEDYADYRLLDMEGNLVRRGHKQAFCLIDLFRMEDGNGSTRPTYTDCGFQGISAGWADIYNRALDCQWVDITGVEEGRYVLEVVVNPARVIEEGSYSNNAARTEVFIPRP